MSPKRKPEEGPKLKKDGVDRALFFNDVATLGEIVVVEPSTDDEESINRFDVLPDGWVVTKSLASELDCDPATARKSAELQREEHPEWFGVFFHPKAHRETSCYHPRLVERLKERVLEVAPEGWRTNKSICIELGCAEGTTRRLAEQLCQDRPDWTRCYKTGSGHEAEHYHPELAAQIRDTILQRKPAPEGWRTNSAVARELGVDHETVKRLALLQEHEHPDWFGSFADGSRKQSIHYHPELVVRITQELVNRKPAPEGWRTNSAVARELGIAFASVEKEAGVFREEFPEWFEVLTTENNLEAEHYHPELIAQIEQAVLRYEKATEEWSSKKKTADELGVSEGMLEGLLAGYRDGYSHLLGMRKGQGGKVSEHCHEKLRVLLEQHLSGYIEPLSGWQTASQFSLEHNTNHRTVKSFANTYRKEHPEWFADYRDASGGLTEHYHPELLSILSSSFYQRQQTKEAVETNRLQQEVLTKDIREFLTDIDEGESLEAQEFKDLVELFGAEKVVDLLYQYRPEYRKLAVPYVKSALTDYLGDFLVVKGEFSLEGLEKSMGLLVESSFKEGLTEIVKSDCLRGLNQLGKTNLDQVSMQTVLDYLEHIRQKTEDFTTPDLQEVLNEVEAYYQLLFENIHKPDYFVDELEPGRQFPDINQRINVQEIAFKQRMLIADEMGTGKSASAIMAKEILGVKQALIVVPSNVVGVWQGYLSDEAGGYFKNGHAPSVLTVESVEALHHISSHDYDYIIISQERLGDDYVEALSLFEYDMLIVDEMHKLKNLTNGKRAENLLKLAEKVEGEDKYLALLSGTPVPNKVGDVAMALKLLYPEQFKEISNNELVSQILNGDMLDLRSLLVPRMQMKSLAETVDMPELHEEIHRFTLSPQEQEIYNILIEEDELTATQKLKILRQFVLNPRLLDATPDVESSKLKEVNASLQKTFSAKNKVVMFVNGYVEGVMRGEDTIFAGLNLPDDVEIMTIDGSVSKERRLAIQQELQTHDKKILLVVSGQTADVGVDFSAAEEVYFYNEPWTEYDKRQQLGRVYRPGLRDDLISHTFIGVATIEEGIHQYIESKYKAVEKLLRGIPISDLEKQMLKKAEGQEDDLDVSPELAEYYFSSWDKMMKIYGYVKELGEDDFVKFLSRYDVDYADCYADLVGSRSYQANIARLSGTIIDQSVKQRREKSGVLQILDVASGPEMLKRHIAEEYGEKIVSLDINKHHFPVGGTKRTVGSFLSLPVADSAVDYANLSLALHYTSFLPGRQNFERLQVLQELNRVLRVNGRGVISMIYTLGLKDGPDFRSAMDKLGFQVIDNYTGDVESGRNFKTQIVTVEKVRDCTVNTKELAAEIGSQGLQSLKFTKRPTGLHDSRKIVTSFSLGQRTLAATFNPQDQQALEEEREVLSEMERLKGQYGKVRNIPREEIYKGGLSRIFNGKRYVLFKRLTTGSGAVVIR